MVRVLKAACILFTATVVLFIVVNFPAADPYPRDTRAVVSSHPVFNESTRTTGEKIYQLPISMIRKVVGECWTEDAWISEPSVRFRERPRTDQFVNISPEREHRGDVQDRPGRSVGRDARGRGVSPGATPVADTISVRTRSERARHQPRPQRALLRVQPS